MAAATEDPKSYYGYLIEGDDKNKRASPVLDALLKAIARHIVRSHLFWSSAPQSGQL
jgi:hypothetical protein